MSYDIWHQTARALDAEVDAALWKLRESDAFRSMESEIERSFAAYVALTMRIGGTGFILGEPIPTPTNFFFLQPQVQVDQYRVDFVFGLTNHPALRDCVVIECDGHDWHEKTKEQAARDKARDRHLSVRAGRVVHFTGSEIYRDVAACALDALKTLSAVHNGKDVQ